MFSSKKTQASQAPSNFGEEFIHTMKDDLNPSLKYVKPIDTTPNDSPFGVQPTKQSPVNTVTSSISSNPFIEKQSAPKRDENLKNQTLSAPQNQTSQDIIQNNNFSAKEKIYADSTPVKTKPSMSFGILIAILTILILLTLGGGGYYFWITTTSEPTETDKTQEIVIEDSPIDMPSENIPSEDTITISPISEKYSSEKPNYISLNVETMTAEEIKKTFSDTAKEVLTLQSNAPYEFIITDSNNNPLAFPIFATLANINISPSILSSLNEKFSFYIHNTNGGKRTGISIDIKNKTQLLSEMKNEETKTLVDSLSFLFLYEPYVSKKAAFAPTTYNNIDSRYLNLDPGNTLSIDYGIYENKLLIGTSQDSFRAILDKLLSEKAVMVETTPLIQ